VRQVGTKDYYYTEMHGQRNIKHTTLYWRKKTQDKWGMGRIVRCKDREEITTMIMMIRGDRTDHVTTCNYDVITLLLK
jgi:hypothetical protein